MARLSPLPIPRGGRLDSIQRRLRGEEGHKGETEGLLAEEGGIDVRRHLPSILALSTKSSPGFPSVSTSEIWDRIILCPGGYPVHCTMVSSIPGHRCCDNKMLPDIVKCPPGQQYHPWLRKTLFWRGCVSYLRGTQGNVNAY